MAATAPRERAATTGAPGPDPAHAQAGSRVYAAAVLALTLLGLALRIAAARQTLFGDELATYWDIHAHSFTGLISALHGTHIEITPPLFFALAWVTGRIGHSPEWLRLPSLVAGTLTIPAVYALGARAFNRRAGLVAALLTALAPFAVYYSSEARAYALMMLLVTLSTLALLQAVDTGRRGWWVAYALCSAAALYSHYTSVFYLAAQFLWLLWAERRCWRAAVLANVGVAVLLAPWAGAIINANNSPTTAIMSALAPFDLHDVRIYLEHWAIGYAYPAAGGLSGLPGTPAVVLLLAAIALAAAAWLRQRPRRPWNRRSVLIVALLVATPLGEALQSATGTHVFGVRNLAASWPALALVVGALLVAPPRPIAAVATGLAAAALAIAAVTALAPNWNKPDSRSAAAFIARHSQSGDVIVDGSGYSGQGGLMVTPGPPTSLDTALTGQHVVFRAGAPQEDDHPFAFSDVQQPLKVALARAVAAARDRRLIAVTTIPRGGGLAPLPLPAGWRLVDQAIYPGILGTAVRVYTRTG